MEPVIGIDLGTTNSCVAIMKGDGYPKVIHNKSGSNTTPSMVAVTDSGKRLIGQLAKRQAVVNPQNTVYAAKRLIGRRYDDREVQKALKTIPYKTERGPHDDVRISLRNHSYAVPEISSMILNGLRMVAQDYLGRPVTKAVVTVPAYFNDNQRQATKDAGKIAGLEVLRIINEPTAAALTYGFSRNVSQKVAVFDLGGGTFDISILEIDQGVFNVITSAGDTFLGGEDFDERIMEWLVLNFAKECKVDLRTDRMALQRLKEAAENAKIELSTVSEVQINLPFIYSTPEGETLHLTANLSRDKLNELGADLVERCMHICTETMQNAGIKPADLDDVLMVGGMSRMPAIRDAVTKCFGITPSYTVHPDEAVALGAAIQGWLLVSGNTDTLLLDVTPHDFGILVAGGDFNTIIPKDTAIPTSARKVFTTMRDNQTQVRIMIMQESSNTHELLGEFALTGLREAPKGAVRIEVTFQISADGIVSVYARDLETNRCQSVTVTASSGLTNEEIQRMIQENTDYLVTSEATQKFETLHVEAERYLRQFKLLLPKAIMTLRSSSYGDDALQKASTVVSRLQEAIKRRDLNELENSLAPLKRTVELFEKLTKDQ